MACACKSNSGVKKQATQVRRVLPASSSHVVTRSVSKPERKKIVIRRPAR